ncbi:hypothetical protein SuNHUV7_40620 (plasmid) [Pseudoseohaeicola sp. NH-UV-7]
MQSSIKTIRKISAEVVKFITMCHFIQTRVNEYH